MTTKEIIKEKVEAMPEKQAIIIAQFLLWLEGEKLTKAELKKVERGKAEIDRGEYIEWRDVAKSKV